MNPFIVITLILVVVSYLGSTRISIQSNYMSKKKYSIVFTLEKAICIFLLFIFWALTAFRSINIGNDTKNYVGVFNTISQRGLIPNFYMERGYQYINLLISKIFGSNPHIFLLSCATVSYIGITVFILRKSKNYYLSVCLSFCLLFSCYTNTIRQGLAMILGVIVYQLISNNRRMAAICIILLATSIHSTAVILFTLFLYKFIPRKYSTIIMISIFLLAISMTGALNAIFYQIVPRGKDYFISERVTSGYLALSYELIRDMFFCFLAYKSYKNMYDLEGIKRRLTLFTIPTFISCLSFNMNLLSRANGYFWIIMIVELPNVLYDLDQKKRKRYAWYICVVMLAYFLLIQIIRPEWNHLVPYEFWRN